MKQSPTWTLDIAVNASDKHEWLWWLDSLVIFRPCFEWWKSSLFPHVDWGEWGHGFHGDACNPVCLWGSEDCSLLSPRVEMKKRGQNQEKGRQSQLGFGRNLHIKYGTLVFGWNIFIVSFDGNIFINPCWGDERNLWHLFRVYKYGLMVKL